jgi:hypothetical protein
VRCRRGRTRHGLLDLEAREPLGVLLLDHAALEGEEVAERAAALGGNVRVGLEDNFYLPDGKGPFPGVLLPCGHSTNGKAAEAYQRAADVPGAMDDGGRTVSGGRLNFSLSLLMVFNTVGCPTIFRSRVRLPVIGSNARIRHLPSPSLL